MAVKCEYSGVCAPYTGGVNSKEQTPIRWTGRGTETQESVLWVRLMYRPVGEFSPPAENKLGTVPWEGQFISLSYIHGRKYVRSTHGALLSFFFFLKLTLFGSQLEGYYLQCGLDKPYMR